MAEKEMRVCTVSHEVPGDRPGRFKRFESGEFYPADEIEEGNSKPVTEEIRKAKIIEVMKRILGKGKGLGADGKPDVKVVSRLAKVKLTAKERDEILNEINGEEQGGEK